MPKPPEFYEGLYQQRMNEAAKTAIAEIDAYLEKHYCGKQITVTLHDSYGLEVQGHISQQYLTFGWQIVWTAPHVIILEKRRER